MVKDEGEDNVDEDEGDAEYEVEQGDDAGINVSEGVLSISPLHYAIEFPSPSQQPYVQSIYDHEVDLDFNESDPKEVRTEAR